MRNIITFSLLLFLLILVPAGHAVPAIPEWETSCVNSTHLFKYSETWLNNELYESNQTILCPYGCDQNRDMCWKWPGNAIPGEYYIIFIIFSLAVLSLNVTRMGVKSADIQPYDIFFSLLAIGMFFVLALQGNNVIDLTTGEAVQIPMVVWYCFGFAGLSIAVFMFNVFKFIQGGFEHAQ